MGYNPQESLENTINTMGTLLGVHPIVPWLIFCPDWKKSSRNKNKVERLFFFSKVTLNHCWRKLFLWFLQLGKTEEPFLTNNSKPPERKTHFEGTYVENLKDNTQKTQQWSYNHNLARPRRSLIPFAPLNLLRFVHVTHKKCSTFSPGDRAVLPSYGGLVRIQKKLVSDHSMGPILGLCPNQSKRFWKFIDPIWVFPKIVVFPPKSSIFFWVFPYFHHPFWGFPTIFGNTHITWATKKTPTFHCTGWLIGILIMLYYNPYITGQYNPLYTLNNQGFFHCSHGLMDVPQQSASSIISFWGGSNLRVSQVPCMAFAWHRNGSMPFSFWGGFCRRYPKNSSRDWTGGHWITHV